MPELQAGSPPDGLQTVRLRGDVEYLGVAQRLVWLRRDHPDATIETEVIRLDDETAVFRARVTIPGGGSATGHGSETASDFTDYIEKAETRALGRALHALGYDLLEPGRQRAANRSAPGAEKGPEPPSGSGSRSSPASRSASASSGGWTEFWQWARAHGYQTRADIERALGGSIEGLPPAEVRRLLEAEL